MKVDRGSIAGCVASCWSGGCFFNSDLDSLHGCPWCELWVRLYQNLLKRIDNISHLQKLTVLDLSFNKIRSMEPLGACKFDQLERLYLSSNKITDVEGIFQFLSQPRKKWY